VCKIMHIYHPVIQDNINHNLLIQLVPPAGIGPAAHGLGIHKLLYIYLYMGVFCGKNFRKYTVKSFNSDRFLCYEYSLDPDSYIIVFRANSPYLIIPDNIFNSLT